MNTTSPLGFPRASDITARNDVAVNAGSDPATAVVLSAGGAYGAYEVGILKALTEGRSPATNGVPLNAHIFTGTSVGAFNAAVMTMVPGTPTADSVSSLEDIWLNRIAATPHSCGNGVFRYRGNLFEYLEPQCFLTQPPQGFLAAAGDAASLLQTFVFRGSRFLSSRATLAQRVLDLFDLSAFISTDPFHHLIQSTIDFSGIRASEKHLCVIATNWDRGELTAFTNSDMTDALGPLRILASAALPGIFPSVQIGEDTYIDGSVVEDTPLTGGIDAGASVLHVIYLDPDLQKVPVGSFQNTLDLFNRVYMIMQATKTNEDIETAKWINNGLAVLDRLYQGGHLEEVKAFARVAGQIDKRVVEGSGYRKLTIHRYHPQDYLGGLLGVLNFNQDAIKQLIDRGYQDATQHDCRVEGCLVPT